MKLRVLNYPVVACAYCEVIAIIQLINSFLPFLTKC
jgi:hypothetical protein